MTTTAKKKTRPVPQADVKPKATPTSAPANVREKRVLVLQGGGALGAYQGGAFQALSTAGNAPDWVAGISIGAINAALIAGNLPERRVERLAQFWDRVSSGLMGLPFGIDDASRRAFNEASSALVASMGVPGFFKPRFPPAMFAQAGTPEATSIYDTSLLRDTLLELVDFDVLNNGSVRLSVGAVQVRTGNMKYFDTAHQKIGPEHIMASGALPPGFPSIEIDGEAYWDGGIVSNTPLQYVLDGSGPPRDNMCVFQIDLFSASGSLPQTLMDIPRREQDIRFSSRTRMNTDVFTELQTLRRAVQRLEANVPESVKNSLDWKLLAEIGCDAAITIVHLIHRKADTTTTQASDYDFSRFTRNERWNDGIADVEQTLAHPAWRDRKPPQQGVTVLDLTRPEKHKAEKPSEHR
jgi:NTE family protein